MAKGDGGTRKEERRNCGRVKGKQKWWGALECYFAPNKSCHELLCIGSKNYTLYMRVDIAYASSCVLK